VGCLSYFFVICVYVYVSVKLYMFCLLSSPYLRVFGDDRVRGTLEQILLMQVAQVKLRCGEGIHVGKSFCYFLWFLKYDVNPYRIFMKHVFSDYGLEVFIVN